MVVIVSETPSSSKHMLTLSGIFRHCLAVSPRVKHFPALDQDKREDLFYDTDSTVIGF